MKMMDSFFTPFIKALRQFSVSMALLLGGFMTAHTQPALQTLTTPEGHTVWLVESHSIPMISVDVAFRAGSAFEPVAQEGLANYMAALLTEGAGHYNDKEFAEEVDRIGAQISADAGTLNVSVYMNTLAQNKEEAFKLFGLAITEPRFNKGPAKRIQEAMLADLQRELEDPNTQASNMFDAALFGDHPYGRKENGTEDSVKQLTFSAAEDYHAAQFTKANMTISVVGDITANELMPLIDKALRKLPAGTQRNAVTKKPAPITAQTVSKQMNVPQASVIMGHLGITRNDPDYFAAQLVNHVLGGSMDSRLFQEVRKKRGLAYYASSGFAVLPQQGYFLVKTGTKNEDTQESIRIIKAELAKIAKGTITQEEYDDAMAYLVGSFPLRLDSNRKILSYLTTMQMEDLGTDYMATWVDTMKQVTLEDANAAAKRLIHPDNLITVIVGDSAALG